MGSLPPLLVEGTSNVRSRGILRHTGMGARRRYLVLWRGYPRTEATAEPGSLLAHIQVRREDCLRHVRGRGTEDIDDDKRRCRQGQTRGPTCFPGMGKCLKSSFLDRVDVSPGGNRVRRAEPGIGRLLLQGEKQSYRTGA